MLINTVVILYVVEEPHTPVHYLTDLALLCQNTSGLVTDKLKLIVHHPQ